MTIYSPFSELKNNTDYNFDVTSQIMRGIRIIFSVREMIGVVLIGAFINLLYYSVASSLVYYTMESLKFSELQFSFINNAPGLGLFLGSILIMMGSKIFKQGIFYPLSLVIFTGSLFFIGKFDDFASLFLIFFSMGLSWSIVSIVTVVTIQKNTPLKDQGKVRGITRLITAGSIPLGSYLGGVLLQFFEFRLMYSLLAYISIGTLLIYAIFLKKTKLRKVTLS